MTMQGDATALPVPASGRRQRQGWRAGMAALLLALLVPGPGLAAPVLMPKPSGPVAAGDAWLAYRGAWDVEWKCRADADVVQAVRRFERDALRLTGMEAGAGDAVALRIECADAGLAAATLHAQDESYALRVAADGIRIRAGSGSGVLRALATLRQLIERRGEGWALRAVSIDDAPRFPWRGAMVDVARHFMSVETLKRQIDAMEQVKLNVLHLHLSDDEGFRVQSLAFPRLTEGQQGRFYTREQVRDLVAYAAARGVRVVPEFDVPGHAAAILRAYPQYGPAGQPGVPPGNVLDPTRADTYAFVEALFGEMSALFPDPYFHVGGDEVKGEAWEGDPAIQAFMREHGFARAKALQGHFMRRVHGIVEALDRKMVGWEEIVDGDLPETVLVQSWTSSNFTHAATQAGHPVVVSAGYYLDYLEPASVYYLRDPTDAAAAGVDPAIYARVQAIGNPALSAVFPQAQVIQPELRLSAAQKARVRGAEAPLWSELVTDEMLDARLWPRMAALAERFWSPADVRDVDDMNRRLIAIDGQLVRLGLASRANPQRMAERLAPGEAEVVGVLADLVTPVRNFAHMHKLLAYVRKQPPPEQKFDTVADIARPSNPVALGFNRDAAAFAAGDHARGPALAARLRGWKDNDVRLRALAEGRADLQDLLPASAALARLADAGLRAIEAVQSGAALDAAQLQAARAEIAALRAQEQASSSLFATIVSPAQPPGDLLLAVTDGVQSLVDAAGGR